MNHRQALSSTPRERCIRAVLQFLNTEGLAESLATLEAETHMSFTEPEDNDERDLLITALMAHEERRQAFKTKAGTDVDDLIDRTINALKLSDDRQIEIMTNVTKPHDNSNVISCKFQPHTSASDTESSSLIVATGGVDKRVVIQNLTDSTVINTLSFAAPVLSLDFSKKFPHMLVVGQMNGHVTVCDTSIVSELVNRSVVSDSGDHTKYVVSVKFSPSSLYYASASTDGTLAIHRHDSTDADNPWPLYHRMEYRSPLESIAWYSDSLLYTAPREDNYLHVINVDEKREMAKYNMNASGDDHVSFSAMSLAFSPNNQLLAIATDQHRLLILAANTNVQVRNCYSLSNDGYSNPRLCWSHSGRYLYVSQNNATVFVYDVSEGRQVGVLRGHEVNVRDLDCHPSTDALVTVSFDKSARLWRPAGVTTHNSVAATS